MMTCGEATMHLLAAYGMTTAFGIPGVHTLDLCRGMSDRDNGGPIRHVRTRNEQGAGFMAEGWARATGEPGLAVVISGPGVTNATTALGQCYADSLPFLLISAEAPSNTIGKGWGVLHEINTQNQVTEPLCAFSETARCADDVPILIARAFDVFRSQRPRPCHISIPIDVQAEVVNDTWRPAIAAPRPGPDMLAVKKTVHLLSTASHPVLYVGGGAVEASAELRELSKRLACPVFSTTAGKGVVPDGNDRSINVTALHDRARNILKRADLMLVVGSELSETDHFLGEPDYPKTLIRIDIDPSKINDRFPAAAGIVSDARPAVKALLDQLGTTARKPWIKQDQILAAKAEVEQKYSAKEQQHKVLLNLIEDVAGPRAIWAGDPCQVVYTGTAAMEVSEPRSWFYPVGFCALGNALPNAIGAKLAQPDRPVVAIAGDGGFMFTMPELLTAVDLGMALPIVLWDNAALQQIRDGMDENGIDPVGVGGTNPDFVSLAKACHCHALSPDSAQAFSEGLSDALKANRPTLIHVKEDSTWLIAN